MRNVTQQEVKDFLIRMREEHPFRLNPTSNGFCYYTSPTDPDDHCLAGQFLAEVLGIHIPPDRAGVITMVLLDPEVTDVATFERDAVTLLRYAQEQADNHGTVLPWRTAITKTLNLLNEETDGTI